MSWVVVSLAGFIRVREVSLASYQARENDTEIPACLEFWIGSGSNFGQDNK